MKVSQKKTIKAINLIINKVTDKVAVPLNKETKKPLVKWKAQPEKLLKIDEVMRNTRHMFGLILADDIVRIDIDEGKLYSKYIKAMSELNTLIIKTKRGYHIYFKDSSGLSKKYKHNDFLLYNQINCEFFPACHSGYATSWINSRDRKILRLPDELMELTLEWTPYKKVARDDHIIPIASGNRDKTIFKIGCILKDKFSEDTTLRILSTINKYCNKDPDDTGLTEEEIAKKIVFIYNSYESNFIDKMQFIGEDKRLLHPKVVSYILENNLVKVIKEGEERIPVIWDKNMYVLFAEDILRDKIELILSPSYITDASLAALTRLLIRNTSITTSWSSFNNHIYKVFFSDCVVDIETGKILEHNSSFNNTYVIPHTFKDKPYVQMKNTVFYNKCLKLYKWSADDYKMLFDFISSAFIPSAHFKCMMLWEGESNTGKSLLQKSITNIMHETMTSNVSLHQMSYRFKSTELFNKLLNVDGDGQADALNSISMIKKATGGDLVTHEIKGRKVWSFIPFAKHIFAFNRLPLQLEEKSDAFYKRLRVLQFNHVITINHKYATDIYDSVSECIPFFIKNLQKMYLDGVSNSKNSIKQINNLRLESDNLQFFLQERLTPDKDSSIAKVDLYTHYIEFCGYWEIFPQKKKSFYQDLIYHKYKIKRVNKKRDYSPECIIGYKLKKGAFDD